METSQALDALSGALLIAIGCGLFVHPRYFVKASLRSSFQGQRPSPVLPALVIAAGSLNLLALAVELWLPVAVAEYGLFVAYLALFGVAVALLIRARTHARPFAH